MQGGRRGISGADGQLRVGKLESESLPRCCLFAVRKLRDGRLSRWHVLVLALLALQMVLWQGSVFTSSHVEIFPGGSQANLAGGSSGDVDRSSELARKAGDKTLSAQHKQSRVCGDVRLIWTTGPSTFTRHNQQCLESIFRYHPCASVTVYSNTLPRNFFSRFSDVGFSVSVQPINVSAIGRLGNEYGRAWVDRTDEWEKLPHYAVHLSDFVRYAIMYEHGGTYLDFDHVMTNPFPDELVNGIGAEVCMPDNVDCFRLEQNAGVATYGTNFPANERFCAANGVLVNWEKHNPILLQGLKYFDEDYDPTCWGCGGPRMFGRAIPFFPKSVTLAAPDVFYPVGYQHIKQTFSTFDNQLIKKIEAEALGFHLYGKTTATTPLRPNSTAALILSQARLFTDRETPYYMDDAEVQLVESVRPGVISGVWPEYSEDGWSHSAGCRKRDDGRVPSTDKSAMQLPRITAALAVEQHDNLYSLVASATENPGIVSMFLVNNNLNVSINPSDVEASAVKSSMNADEVIRSWNGVVYSRRHMCVAVYNARHVSSVAPGSLGRYIACLESRATGCYFQDEDISVFSKFMLMQEFMKDPLRVHTIDTPAMLSATRSWRFFDQTVDLHTGFARIGTGSIASTALVRQFLCQLKKLGHDSAVTRTADYYFPMLHNEVPNVLEGIFTKASGSESKSSPVAVEHINSAVLSIRAQLHDGIMQSGRVMPPTQFRSVGHMKHGVSNLSQWEQHNIVTGPGRRWVQCHRMVATVETDMHMFPPLPATSYDPKQVVSMVASKTASADASRGWHYQIYSLHPATHAFDNDPATHWMAVLGGKHDRSVTIDLSKPTPVVYVQVCSEDALFLFHELDLSNGVLQAELLVRPAKSTLPSLQDLTVGTDQRHQLLDEPPKSTAPASACTLKRQALSASGQFHKLHLRVQTCGSDAEYIRIAEVGFSDDCGGDQG